MSYKRYETYLGIKSIPLNTNCEKFLDHIIVKVNYKPHVAMHKSNLICTYLFFFLPHLAGLSGKLQWKRLEL